MNCFYHKTNATVASCPKCGKGLCSECARKYSANICQDCFLQLNSTNKGIIIVNITLSIIAGILGCLICQGSSTYGNQVNYLLVFYIFAGVPWGWRTLNMITPNMFIALSIVGWLIYLAIKLGLSICVGLVALPIQIYKITSYIVRVRNNDKYIRTHYCTVCNNEVTHEENFCRKCGTALK